jgi:hypothetical protein
LATSKAVRADDVSGLNIATASFTEDAVTKDVQRVILNNSTDGTMATVGAAGLKVDPSGATSPVSIAGTVNVRVSDGTNPITKTYDLDSGAGTEYVTGVGLRKAASGGSVEAGTSSDPLRIDPTGTTVQPVSASSLPLPTGAATLAKQPALGTAGAASADVITIQGIASMTKLLVTPDSVALPANQSVNQNQLAGTTIDVNSGNKSNGTQRVVLATDQPQLTNALKVDGSAVIQPISGTVTATLSGSIANTGFNVTPATSGGTSAYHAVAAASNNAASIKGSAGQVFGCNIYNNAAYPIYVKLYNKATSPAPATDNGLLIKVFGVQAGTQFPYFNVTGVSGFTNGIGIAVVKGITDTDNTALALSDCLIEIDYK